MSASDSNQSPEAGADTSQRRGTARFFGRRVNLQTPTEALHPDTPPPPPVRPNSKRRPMLSALSGVMSFLLIAAVLGVGLLAYASSKLAEPGPLAADKVVFIAPRTEVSDIVDQLNKSGVVAEPMVLKLALIVDRKWSQVKAGEYLFKQHASLNDVMETLVSGRTVLHSITIPEGLTSEQIVERLRNNELLTGEIVDMPGEGTLLPDTFRVPRGHTRAALVRQMREQQTRLLDQVWERRAQDIPVRSKMEMLTLASIIEKETGRADERTRVAAVFYNRLRRGMKLQSDPTIVYGLVGGKGTLGRPIQRDEILRATRYNTYVIPALPPGPIANPGRASLEAAANPSRTSDLYFVANGTGGHTFAESLDQHNRNVQRWREIERERAAIRATQPVGQPAGTDVNATTDRVAPGAEPDPQSAPPALSPARGRRSDVQGGDVFGEVPELLQGQTVALGDLSRELKAANLPRQITGAAPQLAPGITAYAPVATPAPEPAGRNARRPQERPQERAQDPRRTAPQPASAPAQPAASGEPSRFQIGAGIGELKISGVDTRPSPLDGPVDEGAPAAAEANMEVYPVQSARRNEMNARAAMYGAGAAPTTLPEPAAAAGSAEPAPAPARRKIVDASEGTALDPLRARGWDLNAAQNVPNGAENPAAPAPRRR